MDLGSVLRFWDSVKSKKSPCYTIIDHNVKIGMEVEVTPQWMCQLISISSFFMYWFWKMVSTIFLTVDKLKIDNLSLNDNDDMKCKMQIENLMQIEN